VNLFDESSLNMCSGIVTSPCFLRIGTFADPYSLVSAVQDLGSLACSGLVVTGWDLPGPRAGNRSTTAGSCALRAASSMSL
jgi:hypothetical protein